MFVGFLKIAQNLYDECEDHYSQLKSKKDEESTKLFDDSIAKFTNANTSEYEALIEKVHNEAKNIKSEYFKVAFPMVFE